MGHRPLVAALVALVVLPFSSVASAAGADVDPPPPPPLLTPAPPPAAVEAPRRWYGWQMLASYGIADPMLAASLPKLERGAGSSVSLALTSLTLHALTGPAVHFAHGNVGRGFGSLGMNLLTTGVGSGVGLLVGGIATISTSPCVELSAICDPDRSSRIVAEGAIIGGAIGLFAANLVDVAALAYDHPKPNTVVEGMTLAPLLTPTVRGAAIAGVF